MFDLVIPAHLVALMAVALGFVYLYVKMPVRTDGKCPHGVELVKAVDDCPPCKTAAMADLNATERDHTLFRFLEKSQEKHWDFIGKILADLQGQQAEFRDEMRGHRKDREKEMNDYYRAELERAYCEAEREQRRRKADHQRELDMIRETMSPGPSYLDVGVRYEIERIAPADGLVGVQSAPFSDDDLFRLYGAGHYRITRLEDGRLPEVREKKVGMA